MISPYYDEGGITIYCADCRDVLHLLGPVDVVLTDPPYPNGAGHFVDAIAAVCEVLQSYRCPRWFVFWDEMTWPPVPLPLVARHIWHRTNTNRPDNYEAIYEFNKYGIKQPSRVFAYPVVYPGLTGCVEATGHPTQKSERMIKALIQQCHVTGTILDPFMGSGTTLRAAKDLGRRAIGIEIDESYCRIAVERLRQETLDLFVPEPSQPEQVALW